MIGILILITAIYLYLVGNKRISILIFLGMLNKGYQVLTDNVIGIKNLDIAFIYMVVICIYSQIYEKPPKDEYGIRKHVYWLFAFMLCSVLFSYVHYGFTFTQILQGSRHLLFFLSYLFLRKIKTKDFLWILHKFYYITLIVSILYIIQVLFNLPVLPYTETIEDVTVDRYTGVARYYNSPVYLNFWILTSILHRRYISDLRFSHIAPFVFIIALLCTQGRTAIGITFATLLLGVFVQGRISSSYRIITIIGIAILPFSDLLISRFEGGKRGGTSDDFENIINGKFIDAVERGQGVHNMGTLTYRFAWVYERAEYLSNRPLGEKIFGLGLISNSQSEIVRNLYHFKVGLSDERGNISQMTTPDIAWGNMLSQWGYVGGILLLSLWIRLLIIFYKNKNVHPFLLLAFLSILQNILGSFAGAGISNTALINFYFCFIAAIPSFLKQSKRMINVNSTPTITS